MAEPSAWLVRVPLVFSSLSAELFKRMGVTESKKLGQDYHLIPSMAFEALRLPEAELLVSWNLPVQHAWPCDPRKMQGFVEKAAQALAQKFGEDQPQAILVGSLNADPSQRSLRALASNLRGRVLQVFPGQGGAKLDAEAQEPAAPTLYALVGHEGLYAGMQSPRACGGFHPGGTKFIKQGAEGSISRAGAKIVEALHYLLLHRPALPAGSHWLELGASPGGMTSELLARGFRVTAVDRAPLDARLRGAAGLTFLRADVSEFRPRGSDGFDAVLCDLNGEALASLQHVLRLVEHLRPGGLAVFTLKLGAAQTLPEMLALSEAARGAASGAGLSLITQTHLSYNRHEFTMFFERSPTPVQPTARRR